MNRSLLMGCFLLILSGCTKEEKINIPEEVNLKLGYTFVESENMARGASDLYASFYDAYIKTKKLTPRTYKLKFTQEGKGEVLTINGQWEDNDAIRLVEGIYTVTGTSAPIETQRAGMPSDTVYLAFNEQVQITKDMSRLQLTANYDSFLLLFDKDNCEEIHYKYDMEMSGSGESKLIQKDLLMANSLYMLFVKDLKYGVYVNDSSNHYIKITRSNGGNLSIVLNDIPFEKGKFYYFNNMTNSFDIPPMENGN